MRTKKFLTACLLTAPLTLSACDSQDTVIESDDELLDAPIGVDKFVEADVTYWTLTGLEAHEWYREHVERSAGSTAAQDEFIDAVVLNIDAAIEQIEIEGFQPTLSEERFRAKIADVKITPIYDGDWVGLKAWALADKTGIGPVTTNVDTYSRVGESVHNPASQQAWGWVKLTQTATAKDLNPGSCYAAAWASSGGTSTSATIQTCPDAEDAGSGPGGSGPGGNGPGGSGPGGKPSPIPSPISASPNN